MPNALKVSFVALASSSWSWSSVVCHQCHSSRPSTSARLWDTSSVAAFSGINVISAPIGVTLIVTSCCRFCAPTTTHPFIVIGCAPACRLTALTYCFAAFIGPNVISAPRGVTHVITRCCLFCAPTTTLPFIVIGFALSCRLTALSYFSAAYISTHRCILVAPRGSSVFVVFCSCFLQPTGVAVVPYVLLFNLSVHHCWCFKLRGESRLGEDRGCEWKDETFHLDVVWVKFF